MARKYSYDHPRPMVTTDCALFRLKDENVELLMVRRGKPPHKGSWVLPGGFIRMKEPLETAAIRELGEETGIKDIPFLVQIGAYGDPKRDPRGRVITVAFAGIVSPKGSEAKAGSDAADAQWFPIEQVPGNIGFDHPAVIGDALRKIATLGRTSGALFVFLDDSFTRDQLRTLLKALYGVALDPDAYINTFMEMGLVKRSRAKGKFRFGGRAVAASNPSRKPAANAKAAPSKKKPATRKK